MPHRERSELIRKIQERRQSKVICYLTSLRPNVPAAMSDDAVRVMFDYLLRLEKKPIPRLDIFLCTNGGSGTVPWRMVSVFREFSKSLGVLVPYRAYSAGTLLALGADEIVMHPFAELGPIDPTVGNPFNPIEQGSGRRIGISVEDVRAYISFVKSSGITHEDELIKAIEILANKVHPLALGNVERFLQQSRMIATKIMRTHCKRADDHKIKEIVENLASKLYFHGHPINRKEAKEDLKLQVKEVPEVEDDMWKLYLDFESEFENQKEYNPIADMAAVQLSNDSQATSVPPPAKDSPLGSPGAPPSKEYELLHTVIEDCNFCSRQVSRRRVSQIPPGQPGHPEFREELLGLGWSHSEEEPGAAPARVGLKEAEDTRTAPLARGKRPAMRHRRERVPK